MSAERSQPDPETGITASAPRHPAAWLVTAAPPSTQLPAPAGQADAVPALLVSLLQEYAAHQGPIAEVQRRRREFGIIALILGGGGGLLFLVCAIWMGAELAGGLSPTRPAHSELPMWLIGMVIGGFFAFFIGLTWLMMLLDERQKVAVGEAGKTDVMRRLLAAFPQLQEAGARALLSEQAITTRPTR